jgi:hypothetical protein
MKIAVFWVVAPCSLVEVYQRFRDPCCLHHQGDALMMEATRTSKTLVNFYQTTRCYNPEDSNLHTHRRENLKSCFKPVNLKTTFFLTETQQLKVTCIHCNFGIDKDLNEILLLNIPRQYLIKKK